MIVVKNHHNSGFSLIELIAVIVLLGILGVVALGRFSGQDVFAARGFFDDTVTAVRFAQKLAVSSGCDVRVETTLSGYRVLHSTNCADDDFLILVKNPADRSNNYTSGPIPDGYSLTAGTITFDARGSREEATSTFDLDNGSTSFSFRVHTGTGLVEVI